MNLCPICSRRRLPGPAAISTTTKSRAWTVVAGRLAVSRWPLQPPPLLKWRDDHLPPVNTSNLLLSAPSPLSFIPSGGPLLADHTTHSVGGMINWGSPPPSSGIGGGGARPGSTCSGQMPPVLVSVSSRPSSRQSASWTARPPSVSPAFSPAPNSVLGGFFDPSPVLTPLGNPSGLDMSGGSTCLATTAGTSLS